MLEQDARGDTQLRDVVSGIWIPLRMSGRSTCASASESGCSVRRVVRIGSVDGAAVIVLASRAFSAFTLERGPSLFAGGMPNIVERLEAFNRDLVAYRGILSDVVQRAPAENWYAATIPTLISERRRAFCTRR